MHQVRNDNVRDLHEILINNSFGFLVTYVYISAVGPPNRLS